MHAGSATLTAVYLSLECRRPSVWNLLTLSLPQPVKYPGWKMHGRASNSIFSDPITSIFQCYEFWWKYFHVPVRKRRQKGLRVSNFAHLCVVFKWHRGSEGVNNTRTPRNETTVSLLSVLSCRSKANIFTAVKTIQYNFIAKCQYNGTRNVLWCQVHSSHIHSNHKTLNYNNIK